MQLVRFMLSLSCIELIQQLQEDVDGFVKTIVYAKLDLCGLGYELATADYKSCKLFATTLGTVNTANINIYIPTDIDLS